MWFLLACSNAPDPHPAAEAADPRVELAKLDTRTPVPLLPRMAWHQKRSMMEHLEAIQGIHEGLAADDFEAVATAASAIASSPSMQMQCEHMGAGAEGFTALALDFHQRADAIVEAARRQDRSAVLEATASTLAACTSCHATYRQDVVDAATYEARTGSSHQP